MNMRLAAQATAILLVLSLNIPGCGGTPAGGNGVSTERLKLLSHSMMVKEFTGDVVRSTALVTGKAKNVSDSSIGSAMIAVNFYDGNGDVLYASSAVKQNLAPGEVWEFAVQATGPDAWKIKRYDISASARP